MSGLSPLAVQMDSFLGAWPVVVFGAPGALVGLAACLFGLLTRRPWWLVAGGVLLLPSSVYLGAATYRLRMILWLLPLLPLLAAFMMRRNRPGVATLLVLPNAAVVMWLCVATGMKLVGR